MAWWEAIPEGVRAILERRLQYAFASDPNGDSDFPSEVARVVVPWAGWRSDSELGAEAVLRQSAKRLDEHVRYLAEERTVKDRYGGLYSPDELAILIPLDYYEYAHASIRKARLGVDIEFHAALAMWKAFEKDIERTPGAWRERIRGYVYWLARGGPKAKTLDPARHILVDSQSEDPLAGGAAILKHPRAEKRWFHTVQPFVPHSHTRLEEVASDLCGKIMGDARLGAHSRQEAAADAAYLLLVDEQRARDDYLRGLHGFNYGVDEWIRELSYVVLANPDLRDGWHHACTLRGVNRRAREVLQPHPIRVSECEEVAERYKEPLLAMVGLVDLPVDLSHVDYQPNRKLVRTILYLAALGYTPDKWTYPVMMTLAEWGFESDDDAEKFSTRLRVYMKRERDKHGWLAAATAELKRHHLE